MGNKPCGHKTRNLNGVCEDCRRKIALINMIRSMFGDWKPPKTKTRSKLKEKYAEYPASIKFSSKEQLCWHCEKATGGCSWSKSFTPVEGWTAKPSGNSYRIKACPEYVPLIMKTLTFEKEK